LRQEDDSQGTGKIKSPDPVPATLAAPFREQAGMDVEEGREKSKKAMVLRSEFAHAMAYLHLLYRKEADMETAQELLQVDVKTADALVDQAKAIGKKKLERSSPQSSSV
jgi:hypothetical protein